MTVYITGALGFIGSNLVKYLNDFEIYDIVLIDTSEAFGNRFKYINGLEYDNFYTFEEFKQKLSMVKLNPEDIVIHLGANSSTSADNYPELYENNTLFSKVLIDICAHTKTKLIYASSMGVYGLNKDSEEKAANEAPITAYGFSKLIIDKYNRSRNFPAVGLRIANCYGPNEGHKKGQMSPISRYINDDKKAMIVFCGNNGFGDNFLNHTRDFIHVDDVCSVIYHFMNCSDTGIFNVGTGESHRFEEVANLVKNNTSKEIRVENAPDSLIGKTQPYTKANIQNLRNTGYNKSFINLRSGIGMMIK